jgi:hypothetical protein
MIYAFIGSHGFVTCPEEKGNGREGLKEERFSYYPLSLL